MSPDFIEPLKELPSFREQIAYVYDDYMDTLGGGERSALAYALALKQLGFTVEIIGKRPMPDHQIIKKLFGDEFVDIPLRYVSDGNIYTFAKAAEPTVFVNHTFMSFLPNPARIGIYSQMFPVKEITRPRNSSDVEALSSYRFMANNSSFTKQYTDAWWDYPTERSKVLLPPIGTKFIHKAERLIQTGINAKARQFVNIGRFNPGNHNKNQKLIIDSFIEARQKYAELKNWKLILIGNVNSDQDSQNYFQACQKAAGPAGSNIEFRCGISDAELMASLLESAGYVHATGAFIPPGQEPHKCEHYGLGIVEAMSHGCIPLVYARGGIFDVLTPGDMGVPYITREGLVEGYKLIAQRFDSGEATSMALRCLKAASRQSQSRFTLQFAALIKRALES